DFRNRGIRRAAGIGGGVRSGYGCESGEDGIRHVEILLASPAEDLSDFLSAPLQGGLEAQAAYQLGLYLEAHQHAHARACPQGVRTILGRSFPVEIEIHQRFFAVVADDSVAVRVRISGAGEGIPAVGPGPGGRIDDIVRVRAEIASRPWSHHEDGLYGTPA